MTAPAPVPALPDAERRTPYSISAQTGPFSVNFEIYGDATDYGEWVEVWLNGFQLDPSTWVLTSPSGNIGSLPRPITDAVINLNSPGTGTLEIVGARRPRRTSQFTENRGVAARDLNQVLTDIISQMREFWDRTRGRMFSVPAGESITQLPNASLRANKLFGFDGSGNPLMQTVVPSGGGISLLSLTLTRSQIPTVTLAINTFIVSGYSVAGDNGAGAIYTSVGATNIGPGAIQDLSGTWFNLVLGRGPINVGWFGAKGDGRVVNDGVSTSGNATVSSATASFTTADTGKTVVAEIGAGYIASGTYSSGGSITGDANENVTVTGLNGGGSGATAQIQLTGVNAIAGGSPLLITGLGSGYTSAPTSATIGNGIGSFAATASGAIAISTVLGHAPVISTATFIDPTHISLGVTASASLSGVKLTIGTDDSVAILAAIQAAANLNGGTVYYPPGHYLMRSQLAIPNNGSAQAPITLLGAGSRWDSNLHSVPVAECTTLDLLYAAGAKLRTTANGLLCVRDIGFVNSGFDSNAFIDTTNTALNLHRNSFTGAGTGQYASFTDAVTGGALSQAFQGYGTVISENIFDKIARGVRFGQFANAIVVRDNTWTDTCGGNEAILIDGTAAGPQSASKNVFFGNLVELGFYRVAVSLINTNENMFIANTYWDIGAIYYVRYNITGSSPDNSFLDADFISGQALDPSSNGYSAWGKDAFARSLTARTFVGVKNTSVAPYFDWLVPGTNEVKATLSLAGVLEFTGSFGYSFDSAITVGAHQVVNVRDTGWTAMSGTPNKATAYDTSTVTLAQLAGRVAQLQASLSAHGLIGT